MGPLQSASMSNLILSIVIPCLDEKDTIVASVKDAQKYAKLYFPHQYEVIVADNGSTDGTLKIIAKLRNLKVVPVPV